MAEWVSENAGFRKAIRSLMMTEGVVTSRAIEGVEDEVTPDSSGLRTAAKGAAAAAAVGAAAMAAREVASRLGGDGDTGDEE